MRFQLLPVFMVAGAAFAAAQAPSLTLLDTQCNNQYDQCRTAPNANQAACAAQVCNCFNGAPGAPSFCAGSSTSMAAEPTATSTADKCNTQYDQCRTGPDANQAACAAQVCGCFNGAPGAPSFCAGSSTSMAAEPTATSTADKCNTQYDQCRTGPDANQASCAAQVCGCFNGAPGAPSFCAGSSTITATYGAHPIPTSVSDTCNTQYDQCRVGPSANQAACAAQVCQCFNGAPGAPSFCAGSSSTTATYEAHPTTTSTADNCNTQYDQCRVGPSANQAACAAQVCQCFNGAPGAPSFCSATPSTAVPSYAPSTYAATTYAVPTYQASGMPSLTAVQSTLPTLTNGGSRTGANMLAVAALVAPMAAFF